jgi:hypothetical protein
MLSIEGAHHRVQSVIIKGQDKTAIHERVFIFYKGKWCGEMGSGRPNQHLPTSLFDSSLCFGSLLFFSLPVRSDQFAACHCPPNARPGCKALSSRTASATIAPSKIKKSVSEFHSLPSKPSHSSAARKIDRARMAIVASSSEARKALKTKRERRGVVGTKAAYAQEKVEAYGEEDAEGDGLEYETGDHDVDAGAFEGLLVVGGCVCDSTSGCLQD